MLSPQLRMTLMQNLPIPARDVFAVTGIKPVTLNAWIARGIFKGPPGQQGVAREYRWSDVIQLSLIQMLSSGGVQLKDAVKKSGEILDRLNFKDAEKLHDSVYLTIAEEHIIPPAVFRLFYSLDGVTEYFQAKIDHLASNYIQVFNILKEIQNSEYAIITRIPRIWDEMNTNDHPALPYLASSGRDIENLIHEFRGSWGDELAPRSTKAAGNLLSNEGELL